jgi:uncharacterized protein (DUF885 family)
MTPATAPAWIETSNRHAAIVLDWLARFRPEVGSLFGVPGSDERVLDLGPRIHERRLESAQAVAAALEAMAPKETDPAVRQDLAIMLDAVRRDVDRETRHHAAFLPYANVPEVVFDGLRTLLAPQNPAPRRALALARLKLYAGRAGGATPLVEQARARFRERASDRALLGPAKAEVEKDLGTRHALVDGLAPLFDEGQVAGSAGDLEALRAQLADDEAFVRAEVLPRARDDFKLPPDLYTMNLRDVGVDMPIEELSSRARVAFREIQNEMQAVAGQLARERKLPAADYRAVLAGLKKVQLTGDAILPHYQARLAEIEAIIRRERIVSLPTRPAQIRLASEAETAAQPAPHMDPPRLMGNTGERGTFVLPLAMSASPGQEAAAYDDFTFEAASWTLTAHEARPGHELQFAAMVERGVSVARQLFAFNSVNVEGWALYMEAETKPYEPLDGQLGALQHRLLRAARAFLDPGVQSGAILPAEAKRVLMEDVVVSEGMARQEIERYMFRAPGQATSYFCGYQRLMELRTDVERLAGGRFDRLAYHDFVLAQGLLPPRLLREAVLNEFLPAALGG